MVRNYYRPSSEKMKPKCDMEVKKSKSEVMLGLQIDWVMAKDKKNEAGFIFSEPGL